MKEKYKKFYEVPKLVFGSYPVNVGIASLPMEFPNYCLFDLKRVANITNKLWID